MSWNPFGKNSSSSTRRSVFTKSLDRDIEREHKKLEYLEETTKKLQKDLKKCNDSTHDFAAANLKIVSNLKTSSLYAKDADFARNVDQCFVAAKEIESAAQSVVAVTTKTAVNRAVMSASASRSPRRRPLSHRGVTISRFSNAAPPPPPDDDDAELEELTDAIEDANVNLKNLDGLVKDYSQVHSIQSQTIHRLKTDLEKNHERLREERLARHRRHADSSTVEGRLADSVTLQPVLPYQNGGNFTAPPIPNNTHPAIYGLNPNYPNPTLIPQSLPNLGPQILGPNVQNYSTDPLRTSGNPIYANGGTFLSSHDATVNQLLESARDREVAKWKTANAFMEQKRKKETIEPENLNETLDKRLNEIERTLETSRVIPTTSTMPGKSSQHINGLPSSLKNNALNRSPSLFSVAGSESGASGILDGISTELRSALEREEEKEEERRRKRTVNRRVRTTTRGVKSGDGLEDHPVNTERSTSNVRGNDEVVELKAVNESLRREMEQIKGGENYFVTRIEELERLVGRLETDKEEARKTLAEWSERGGEEEAKRRRDKLIHDDERERNKIEKERLEAQLADASHRAFNADGLRLRVDELESAVDSRDSRVQRLEDELRDREEALVEMRRRCREAQAAETTAKEDTDEAIRIADDMRNSINKLEEEKSVMEEEAKDSREKIKGLVEKYEEMKGKAHEAIRQWKTKVKKMETEVKKGEETAEQLREANSKLVVETESVKARYSTANERGEKLLNEVDCFGEIKSRLEEQLRIAEIQCEEGRSEILEKTSSLKEVRETYEILEGEAIELRAKTREAKEERCLLEERLKQMIGEVKMLERDKAAAEKDAEEMRLSTDRNTQIASENEAIVKEMGREKLELEKQLRIVEDQRKKETSKLQNAVESLKARLEEAEETVSSKDESASTRQREMQTRVENLKLDVAEKAASEATALEKVNFISDELSKLKRDYDRLGEEYDKSAASVKSLKDKLDKREELTKDFDRRLRTLNASHEDVQETLRRKERETLQLFRGVDGDLDEVVILASRCSAVEFTSAALTSSAAVTPSTSNGESLLNALKPKLKWVSNVVGRMGKELNEAKTELVSARHQASSLEANLRDEKEKRNRIDAAHTANVKSMEETFSRLSTCVENHAERDIQHVHTLLDSTRGANEIVGNMSRSGDGGDGGGASRRPTSSRSEISPRSKDEIEKRYRGYRETVDNLQRDLIEVANATPRVVYARSPSPTIMRGGGNFLWTSTPAKDQM